MQGDLLNRAALDAAFEKYKPEAVAHFAALIEAGESMQNPGVFFQNNVSGGISLASAYSGVPRRPSRANPVLSPGMRTQAPL